MAKIQELQKKYSLSKDDFWNLTGNVWIIKHDAVEKIAKMENVIFENPTIQISERDCCVLFGSATIIKEDKKIAEEWSFGEADLKLNCKNKYPYAMAEKRLKDRLTLKLISAYEYGIYSDTEADSFKKQKPKAEKLPTPYENFLEKKNEVPVKDDLPLNKSKKSWAKNKIQPDSVEELF